MSTRRAVVDFAPLTFVPEVVIQVSSARPSAECAVPPASNTTQQSIEYFKKRNLNFLFA